VDDESSSFAGWMGKSENTCSGLPKTTSFCPNSTDTAYVANVELPIVQSSNDSMNTRKQCPYSSNTESAPTTDMAAIPLHGISDDSACRCQIMQETSIILGNYFTCDSSLT
jgi:hypothetical protein